jgi:DNA modification methylase
MTPYYEADGITIWHGDCRDVADAIQPRSIDALITDPPYGMAFVSGWTAAKATVRSDGVRQGARVVRSGLNALEPTFGPDMHALVFCHWESWPDFYDNVCHLFPIRNALVWSKGGGGMGDLRHEYAKDYEIILFGARGRGRELAGKRVGAVLAHPRVPAARRNVPFEKPVPLLAELVARHAPLGGVVLDPFMGSGPTLVAAQQTGRRAIGIEIEERYCEIAAKRLAQRSLFAPDDEATA